MIKGIDEDWAKATPWLAKQSGYTFIIGYVSEDNTGKNLTRFDVDLIHDAGMDVGLVYEFQTDAALSGGPRGTRDADIAIAHAHTLGAPRGTCLYAAVDFDAQPVHKAAVSEYIHDYTVRCWAAGFTAGVYGSIRVCGWFKGVGYPNYLWQTYAWSGGAWLTGATLHQTQNGVVVAGARVDIDEAEVTNWGQWSPEATRSGAMILVRPTGQPANQTDAAVWLLSDTGAALWLSPSQFAGLSPALPYSDGKMTWSDFTAIRDALRSVVMPPAVVDTTTLNNAVLVAVSAAFGRAKLTGTSEGTFSVS